MVWRRILPPRGPVGGEAGKSRNQAGRARLLIVLVLSLRLGEVAAGLRESRAPAPQPHSRPQSLPAVVAERFCPHPKLRVPCPLGPTEQWVGQRLPGNLSSTAGRGSPRRGAGVLIGKRSGDLCGSLEQAGPEVRTRKGALASREHQPRPPGEPAAALGTQCSHTPFSTA